MCFAVCGAGDSDQYREQPQVSGDCEKGTRSVYQDRAYSRRGSQNVWATL